VVRFLSARRVDGGPRPAPETAKQSLSANLAISPIQGRVALPPLLLEHGPRAWNPRSTGKDRFLNAVTTVEDKARPCCLKAPSILGQGKHSPDAMEHCEINDLSEILVRQYQILFRGLAWVDFKGPGFSRVPVEPWTADARDLENVTKKV